MLAKCDHMLINLQNARASLDLIRCVLFMLATHSPTGRPPDVLVELDQGPRVKFANCRRIISVTTSGGGVLHLLVFHPSRLPPIESVSIWVIVERSSHM